MKFLDSIRCSLKPVVCISLLLPAIVFAEGYASNPDAQRLIDDLVANEDFDRAGLETVFAGAERQEKILKAIARPAEKTKPWYEYREIFITDKRIVQGLEFYGEHRVALDRAERETGVPAELIAAVIGVETYYGRITGSYRVLDALSTLAFDYPPRSDFFSRELRHFLILTREQGLDPTALKGSYAGAMGYGQFMPSSYRSYAVDFDGDGQADIWNNPVDAIGSVANYFKRHGWRAGEPVVSAAVARGEPPGDWLNSGLKPSRSIGEFSAAGLDPVDSLPVDAIASGMQFELEDGYEYWLGLHNFYVITRYNHSAMYAMSVYQLGQQLRAGVRE